MEAFAGRLTAGDLIAFVYYCVEISNSTEKTFRIYSDLMSLSGAVERVASLVAPDVGGQETPSIVPSGASGRQGAALGEDDDRAVSIPLASTARPASSAQGDVEQTTQASRRGSAKAASASGRSPSPPPRAAAGGGRHPQSGAHELAAIPRSPAVRLHCAVEFRDVWFRYEGSGCELLQMQGPAVREGPGWTEQTAPRTVPAHPQARCGSAASAQRRKPERSAWPSSRAGW